jgi:hypothetical protein
MNILDNIKPTCLDDIEIYKDEIESMENWIKSYKDKTIPYKKALLIIGNIGTGKTVLAELLFKKYNYNKIELNSTDFRSQKKLGDFLRKTLCFKNVVDMFFEESSPIGLLMDEIDTMSHDKGGLGEFIQILKDDEKCSKNLANNKKIKNYINLYNPIVCTCLDIYDKKINDLKKYCHVVYLKNITLKDTTNLINKIYKNIPFEKQIIPEIFSFIDGDIRKFLNVLENLVHIKNSNNKKIKLEDFKKLRTFFEKKNNDIQLLEATHNIFFKKIDFETSIFYYQLEPYFLPYMIYHNLDKFIKNCKAPILDKIKLYKKILNSICMFDIVQNFSFEYNDWNELNELTAFYGVYNINYIVNNNTHSIKKLNIDELEFTNIMNKMSQSLVNKKLINCARYAFKKTYVEINEIIYLSEIFINYFQDFKSLYNNKEESLVSKKKIKITEPKKTKIKKKSNDKKEIDNKEIDNKDIDNKEIDNKDTDNKEIDNNIIINDNNDKIKIDHELLKFMNFNKMTIQDLENILKLEKFNKNDVKIKKNLNVNIIKKIEENLFY